MNWITSFVRPKFGSMLGRREVPENLWIKCPATGEMVFHTDLEENMWVIPGSGHHMRITARQRLGYLFDAGEFEELPAPQVQQDPLKFRDSKKYSDRLRDNRSKTGLEDSIVAGIGSVKGLKLVACAHDFNFIGGSLGVAAGEAIVQAFETAIRNECPLVMFPASGGARMQEGILSLMQLPKTTVAVEMLKEAGLPYIVVLTNPTTGGVTASYAMLGDIHIAEPGAEIGFAGKRVIEQTVHEKLPEGFQTSEYLMEHGMVDMVVTRHELPDTLASLLRMLMGLPAPEEPVSPEAVVEEPEAEAPPTETAEPPAVDEKLETSDAAGSEPGDKDKSD
ncbi:MAG: acetyl-coenzyme A carboxylase carboxyl transferase subunit beta [Rhizobiaceae bacterium MnEN-MB40S]|nr:MAG: acetyl-coenzyme A carboxylase carboxyl transferase subunit beta [Rhizobiaceae bacterium MnEN-MB40S]